MQIPLAAQIAASVAVPLFAVWLTAQATSRETIRAVRAEVSAQRLGGLADDLAQASRDMRDLLFAGDACASCGAGVPARRLIETGARVDRTADLALLHVRDDQLRSGLRRVLKATNEVTRHKKNLDEPCDALLNAAYALVAACDQTAEQCLNFVHEGRAVLPPRIPMSLTDRGLTAVFRLLDRGPRSAT
jgi:hypothetical protein